MAIRAGAEGEPQQRGLSGLSRAPQFSNPFSNIKLPRLVLPITTALGLVGAGVGAGVFVGRQTAENPTQPQPATAAESKQETVPTRPSESMPTIGLAPGASIENLPSSVAPYVSTEVQPEPQAQLPISPVVPEAPVNQPVSRSTTAQSNVPPVSPPARQESANSQPAQQLTNRAETAENLSLIAPEKAVDILYKQLNISGELNKGTTEGEYLNMILFEGQLDDKLRADIVAGRVPPKQIVARVDWALRRFLRSSGPEYRIAYGATEIAGLGVSSSTQETLTQAQKLNGDEYIGAVAFDASSRSEGVWGPDSTTNPRYLTVPKPNIVFPLDRDPWISEKIIVHLKKFRGRWSGRAGEEFEGIIRGLQFQIALDKAFNPRYYGLAAHEAVERAIGGERLPQLTPEGQMILR
jgi:hypothetical protein